MKTTHKILALLVISSITLFFDQWTKNLAIEFLKYKPSLFYFFDTIQLRYAENTGAWGSLGGDWSPLARKLFLIVLPILVLAGLGIYVLINKKMQKAEVIAMACILAGGIGNLIDRVRFDYVVDFMYVGIGPIGTNIFNIADVVIMIGFGVLLYLNFQEWLQKRKENQAP